MEMLIKRKPLGSNIYTLLCTRKTTGTNGIPQGLCSILCYNLNRDQRCTTGSSAQYCVITNTGIESEKNIYMATSFVYLK